MSPRISWEGVFPAVTTQFNDDLSLDIDATAKVMDGLIRDGVSGLIVCGTVGENTSLEPRGEGRGHGGGQGRVAAAACR